MTVTIDEAPQEENPQKSSKGKGWKAKFRRKKKEEDDAEKGGEEEEEEEEGPKEIAPDPVGFFELFRYINKKETTLTFIGISAAVVAGLCMPAMIILFGNLTNAMVYDDIFSHFTNGTFNMTLDELDDAFSEYTGYTSFYDEVKKFGYGTLIIGVIEMIVGYIFVSTLNRAAESQTYRLRGRFLKSILRQEVGWYDTHQTNDFASRVTEDINKMQEGLGEKIGMFVFFFTTFFFSLINAFVHGWELTLVVLSVFPVLGISTGLIAKAQSSLTSRELKEYAKAGSIAEEVLSSIRTVLAFGGEEKEVVRYEGNLVHARTAGIKRGLMTGIGMGVMWFIIYASYALAFYCGTKLIIDSRPPDGDGNYDAEDLIVVFFSVLMGAMNIGQSAPYIEAFQIARGAAGTIFEILERESEIDPTSEKGKKPEKVAGAIAFKNVYFNYPSRDQVKILQGIDLLVKPGQTVALVGSSGCGKSTCIQLVQRFYDPLEGSVLFDGNDIRELNLGWLRDQIGIVGQEPVLFATTIEENIRYGREDVTFKEIEMAAREANAHDFITKLPMNYSTQVGERGVQMSGGQKQRIAIARALVKKPKVLLLDEATSALDNQSEAIVQKALDKARRGRTTIIVAHRLTTIRTADLIVVMEKGSVVETGTHKELMKREGLYKSLVEAQLSPLQKQNSLVLQDFDNYTDEEEIDEALDDILDELAFKSPLITRTPSARQSSRKLRRGSSVSSKGSGKRKLSRKEKKRRKKKEMEEEEDLLPMKTRDIIKWNSPEWPYMLGGLIGSAIQGTLIPIWAILFGEVLGTLSTLDEEEAQQEASKYSVLFLVLGVIAATAMFVQAYMFSYSGEMLTMRLRKRAFMTMLRQEMGWFDEEKNSVGGLCSRLSGDAAAVQGATGSRVGTVVQVCATLISAIIIAMYFSWKLALVALPFVPFVMIAIYIQSKVLLGQNITESKALDDAGKIAIEAISNIRTVASLHKEEEFAKLYTETLLESHEKALKNSHIRGAAFGFAQGIPFIAYAVVMFYGGYLIETEDLGYEEVFKVAEALILGTMMVGQAVAFAPNFSKGKLAASRLNALFERQPKIDSSAGVGLRMTDQVDKITFSDVQFVYPTRPTQPILRGLSLEVNQGETVALVGSSGCGKSTIINLLERFYDALGGKVSINGEDIQALNVGYTRSLFGLVSQEPVLFDRTLAENIAYGDNSREVSLNEIEEVSKQANIHSFVSELPDGYETRVGSKGTQLSGGQKQRIAIARALVRNPSVLLLDEATSALDAESEKIVQETLERVQVGRTSIVIAHRLSTIRHADKIIVLQGGKVVEVGTHDQLLTIKGDYYKLYESNV